MLLLSFLLAQVLSSTMPKQVADGGVSINYLINKTVLL